MRAVLAGAAAVAWATVSADGQFMEKYGSGSMPESRDLGGEAGKGFADLGQPLERYASDYHIIADQPGAGKMNSPQFMTEHSGNSEENSKTLHGDAGSHSAIFLANNTSKDPDAQADSHAATLPSKSGRDSNTQADSQVMDFKHFMNQRSGDYEKYMEGKGEKSQKAFKHFMDQYAADFLQYMKTDGQKGSMNLTQFMDQHAADFKKNVQSTSKHRAADFQQFVGQFSQDYGKFLNAQTDYIKYAESRGQAAAVDVKHFMGEHSGDYEKYTKALHGDAGGENQSDDKKPAQSSGQGGNFDFRQFMNQHSGDYAQYTKEAKKIKAKYTGDTARKQKQKEFFKKAEEKIKAAYPDNSADALELQESPVSTQGLQLSPRALVGFALLNLALVVSFVIVGERRSREMPTESVDTYAPLLA
ncbi:unnamed protein product [Polarella glacialis]|uniref:Uncharacterized protein n=1 Tax=Polarella glacialis TaxID=89957 RepID=A0A813E051_POLGL|nr:unnamed protein product [Polarella glacialis]